MTRPQYVITIDGPAGAGKTSVSRQVAERLGYRYIDTGALYRGVAYETQVHGIGDQDDAALDRLCRKLDLRFESHPNGQRLFSGKTDITDRIRTPEISMLASAVSARKPVRAHLFELQRRMGKNKAAVFEGRDMGTVVFPDAELKFFLRADTHIRARRRYEELKSDSSLTLAAVERDIIRRDTNDSSRSLAPLKPAEDAIIIDTGPLTMAEVVAEILSHFKRHVKQSGADRPAS